MWERRKSELTVVCKTKEKDQNIPESMEKGISLDRWQEAWGRPEERKRQEKDIRKKKEGLKEKKCRARDNETHESTKEKIFILVFEFGFEFFH